MKATGIVRNLDSLGRVVIPKELRRTLDINEQDGLEFFVDGDKIVLRKYVPGCVITGSQEDLISFGGKLYSREAIRQLARVAAES
ncbi:AbrB/MazE/SpoVT family DNA-binding domain-containing protein [Paenibacillus sp. SYP-B4298]|uniref:AbrB/MazE/SpoVT family DNA-binding domain-containing protein n=1 Tax=Paenibacillus sp. SYP-B4298 TaxID=2996034 RepID=UPI0022DD9BB6|nr:AbrB/MazE/SpoVT family DNA-binding domain-containing protein [Paenibacillus sp. SYP-B4298]